MTLRTHNAPTGWKRIVLKQEWHPDPGAKLSIIRRMKIRRTGKVAVTLMLAAGAFALFGQAVRYKPGDRVEVDVIMAGAPERGMWRAGTVKSLDAEAREVIVATDAATDNGGRKIGIPFQSAAKWLRPSAQPAPTTAPAAAEAPPRAPVPQAKAPAAGTPAAAPARPPAERPQGILACPIDSFSRK